MIRTTINLEPRGDQTRSRRCAEITIANVTTAPGRMSDDYAWRVRVVDRSGNETVTYGALVDSYNGDATELLLEVLTEWKSGRKAPIDNHGYSVSPIRDHAAFWKDVS